MDSVQCTSILKSWGIRVSSVSTTGQVQCHCPFHDDKRPSLSINSQQELWFCFAGCGGGHLSEMAARLEMVYAPRTSPEIKIDLSLVLEDELKEFNIHRYSPVEKSAQAMQYIKQRGVEHDTALLLGWLWNTDTEEMVYPVSNLRGETVGILFQKPGGKSTSPDFHKSFWLYGLYETKGLSENVVLVEGPMDVAKVAQAGYVCGAIMGSSPSYAQLMQLGEGPVVLLLDHDAAGWKGTIKAMKMLYELHVEFVLPRQDILRSIGEDPGCCSVGRIRKLVGSASKIPLDINL